MKGRHGIEGGAEKDFLKCFEDWKNRWHKCIISHGDYFEGDKIGQKIMRKLNYVETSIKVELYWDQLSGIKASPPKTGQIGANIGMVAPSQFYGRAEELSEDSPHRRCQSRHEGLSFIDEESGILEPARASPCEGDRRGPRFRALVFEERRSKSSSRPRPRASVWAKETPGFLSRKVTRPSLVDVPDEEVEDVDVSSIDISTSSVGTAGPDGAGVTGGEAGGAISIGTAGATGGDGRGAVDGVTARAVVGAPGISMAGLEGAGAGGWAADL
ncbi:hypothetical protein LAZ67_2003729 [Cordylochernes scorpioides]|uniref:Uncharacterized protein n=1 Tax=Cordylochernes scorpioides TaxID=51811 RepID=A0ABY6K7S8_9ARAC|nr:hypothetical protein LAZ67_2003729 [Cordylochernes scorpioides]